MDEKKPQYTFSCKKEEKQDNEKEEHSKVKFKRLFLLKFAY